MAGGAEGVEDDRECPRRSVNVGQETDASAIFVVQLPSRSTINIICLIVPIQRTRITYDNIHLLIMPESPQPPITPSEQSYEQANFYRLPWKLVTIGYCKTYSNSGSYHSLTNSTIPYHNLFSAILAFLLPRRSLTPALPSPSRTRLSLPRRPHRL
jgi:hypothetical protein